MRAQQNGFCITHFRFTHATCGKPGTLLDSPFSRPQEALGDLSETLSTLLVLPNVLSKVVPLKLITPRIKPTTIVGYILHTMLIPSLQDSVSTEFCPVPLSYPLFSSVLPLSPLFAPTGAFYVTMCHNRSVSNLLLFL